MKEKINDYKEKRPIYFGEKSLDYSGQPSFEFGMICYEILYELRDPPISYFSKPIVLNDIRFDEPDSGVGELTFKSLIEQLDLLLCPDPNNRPPINSVLSNMTFLSKTLSG